MRPPPGEEPPALLYRPPFGEWYGNVGDTPDRGKVAPLGTGRREGHGRHDGTVGGTGRMRTPASQLDSQRVSEVPPHQHEILQVLQVKAEKLPDHRGLAFAFRRHQ